MRSVLSYLGYPLVLVLAMGSFFALVPALGVEWAQTPSTVVGIALMALIERLNPHEPAWNQGRGDTRADAILNLVGGLAPPLLFNALFVAGLVRLGEAVQARIGHGLWPLHWSLGAQIVLAVLVAEFFVYWMHRALHQVASLWRFHAVHHAAERLYWLNANRVHPVESLVAYCPAFGALVFLGAPSMVLGAWGALAGIHGITQHMNASVRLGPLNFILSTPALHRWHHSRNRKYADGNYGAVTIFWDLIFGTRVFPPQPHEPSDLGVDHAPSYVLGSSWQLLSAPFTTRWETGGSPAPSEGGLPAPVSHSSHTGTPS
jgi:sterol desaturase/sphingolipid hydroxylase (fatty acid hydroxylase superfamily)